MSARIRIAVVDREPLFRLGVVRAVSSRRYQIVGEDYGRHQLPELIDGVRPDVLIVDQFDDEADLGTLGAAMLRCPTHILMFADYGMSQLDVALLRDMGVLSLLGRDAPAKVVREAVDRVSVGKRYECASSRLGRPSANCIANAELDSVDLRILKLLSAGATKKKISELLELRDTVLKYRLIKMYHRLGVRNRMQAIERVSAASP